MKLYIPEIGDEIVLSADWAFPLYPETRNETLGAINNHYILTSRGESIWVDVNTLPQMREIDYEVEYPSEIEVDKKCRSVLGMHAREYRDQMYRDAEQNCPKFVQYWEDYRNHRLAAEKIGKPTIDIFLPAGQKLKIDRIYIRKGSSDFSSVTFYAKDIPAVMVRSQYYPNKTTKKPIRFWAKLRDVNQIEFK